jgi:dihydroorotate dehydrogenase electron transfer subunit
VVTILDVVQENPDVKSLFFKYECNPRPGQFVMVWIPNVDEVPMSVSYFGDKKGITVKKVGKATEALFGLKPGDRIGIRGPHGTYFEAQGKKLLVVVGGIGIAPLAPLIENAASQGKDVTLAFGAKTSSELLFLERLKDKCKKLQISTDDGTSGHHGFVTDMTNELLEKESYDEIFTCGPEIMIKKIVDIASNRSIPVWASMERHMKCGVGICDSCAISGMHICMNGPVFSGKTLLELKDFGDLKRDACGRRVQL